MIHPQLILNESPFFILAKFLYGCLHLDNISHLKWKSTTFRVDVQSMLMVIVVNWSNKFLSLCYINRDRWVFWVVLLAQPFLQCLHVPGCIASQKNCTRQVSKVVTHHIGTFLLFNIAQFTITMGFLSARAWKSSQNKHGAGWGERQGVNSL